MPIAAIAVTRNQRDTTEPSSRSPAAESSPMLVTTTRMRERHREPRQHAARRGAASVPRTCSARPIARAHRQQHRHAQQLHDRRGVAGLRRHAVARRPRPAPRRGWCRRGRCPPSRWSRSNAPDHDRVEDHRERRERGDADHREARVALGMLVLRQDRCDRRAPPRRRRSRPRRP